MIFDYDKYAKDARFRGLALILFAFLTLFSVLFRCHQNWTLLFAGICVGITVKSVFRDREKDRAMKQNWRAP